MPPRPDEVARIIEAPVEAFLPDAPVELEERTIRKRLIRYGVYPVEGERVWGATARMLGQLGALLAASRSEPARIRHRRAEPAPAAAAPPNRAGTRLGAAPRPPRPTPPAIGDDFLEEPSPRNWPTPCRPPPSCCWPRWRAASPAWPAGLRGTGRGRRDPRGFDGLDFSGRRIAAELTLLAVAPQPPRPRHRPWPDQRPRPRPPPPATPACWPGPSPIRRSTPRRSPPGRSSAATASSTWQSTAGSRPAARIACCYRGPYGQERRHTFE
jgi:hypothetical protein